MQTQTTQLKNAQETYIILKAKKEWLQQQTDLLNAPLYDMVDAGQISEDEWATKVTNNEFKTGLNAAKTELYKAENNLVAIAKTVVQKHATPEQWAEMQIVWDSKRLSVREKVVELVLQLKED